MPVYITPFYDSNGLKVSVGEYSRKLADSDAKAILELCSDLKKERANLRPEVMYATPDNLQACSQKLYYLEPKWHGDAAAMLEFGHQCLEAGNWNSGIPFILADAHVALSRYEQDSNLYFRQEVVWDDLYSVYSDYLQLYPQDLSRKSQYCHFACLCGQWKVANQLFTELGDKIDTKPFGTEPLIKDFRQRASKLGGNAAAANP